MFIKLQRGRIVATSCRVESCVCVCVKEIFGIQKSYFFFLSVAHI